MTLPRTPLGGRYSLERPLLSSRGGQHWMAIEVSSGRLVVVAICDTTRLGSLSQARGVTHRHLASVIDVVGDIPAGAFPERVKLPAGAGVGVAEHVPGVTLRAQLDGGPLHVAKAVAWVLRLADAVQALHAVGAVHGGISPRSVLAAAEGRAIAPVLSQLVVPPLGAFCPPERLRGAAESATDDVWALYATLYAAITGEAPFSASSRDALLREMGKAAKPLSAFGVDEPALQEIIARGLAPERRGRAADLAELVAALDGWEREPKMMPPAALPPRPAPRGLGNIVGGSAFGSSRDDGILIDDALLPDDQGRSIESAEEEATVVVRPPLPMPVEAGSSPGGSAPRITPPGALPPQPAPTLPKRPSINPFARKQSLVPWLAAGAVVAAGVIYLALSSRKAPEAPPPAPAAPSDRPAPTRSALKPAAKRNPEVLRDACVVAHFAPESFEGQPNFAFVCSNGDFRATARRLHALVIVRDSVDAGDASVADAAPLGSVGAARAADRPHDAGTAKALGWHELPATAIIRKTCCPEAAPIALPQTPGSCEQLQAVVRGLADDSAKSVDLAPGARNFDKAVGCLYAQRVRHGYSYEAPPTRENRGLFQQFLSRAAIIGARR